MDELRQKQVFRGRHFSDSGCFNERSRGRLPSIDALENTLANLNKRISSLSLSSGQRTDSCGSEYSSGFDDVSLKSGSSVDSCFSSVGSLDFTVVPSQSSLGVSANNFNTNVHRQQETTIPNFSGRPDFLQRSFSSPSDFPERTIRHERLTSDSSSTVTSCVSDNEYFTGVNVTVSAQLKDCTQSGKPGWRTWLRGQTRLSQRDRTNKNKIKLSVFDEAGGNHVVSVLATSTAGDLIETMMAETGSEESIHWTIVEEIGLGRAERILEDHEVILTVKDSWLTPRNNRFVFKKEPRKYDHLLNPERLFSDHMKGLSPKKQKLPSEAERAREILMMDLAVESDRTPDLQGDLYLKPSGTGKWRKSYCYLRGSGLHYSSKGRTQDPKHLRCFSRFDDVDLYVVKRAVKRDKVPSPYCIMLKPRSDDLGPRLKEFACISMKDEVSVLSWLSGLRIVKYGSALRQNFIRRTGRDRLAFLADST